ncbi:DUF4012 domain-containing protein [Aeromicrobium stalagmiti]|uniref:DUF4012 domain-containing protein n=1 Tax=Aeromicrobium stalagmiti TaxID=2738988 RepID=UPI001568F026|nr:DUF4012 domain-containing protein [Aeromicrobium stalagmiti]
MARTRSSAPTTGRSRRRLWIALGLVAVVAVVIAGVGAYAYSKLSSARDDLNLASTDANALQDALTAGDQAAARTSLKLLQDHVTSAESSLGSSVLSLAAKTPFVGKNVTAARTISSAVSTVATDGLPPLVDVADKFNAKTFNPQGGTIDVEAIASLTSSLTESSAAISKANAKIQSVDASSLISQLGREVVDVQDKIADADDIAQRATAASRVVPKMLSGQHTYLLMFQNNAEIRATGGLPGAYAGLQVDNGSIKLVGQGTGGSLGDLPKNATPLTKEEDELFTTKLVRDFRDVNFTPDFPRAAQIASAIIENENGVKVDGVLSIDPVTLSYVLKAIGPVDLEDGTRLTADNAIEVLLNSVYVTYPDGNEQDAFFASATQKIFDKVVSGAGDPTALLKALSRATNERRVSLWASSKSITQELDGTPLANALPFGPAKSPAVGFYLNDATGAKMQYYLNYSLTGQATKCTAAGVQSYTSEMTLKSTAPADSASLPASIQGPGFGAEPGSMLMNLYLYGPDSGEISTIKADNKEVMFTRYTHEGRPVIILTLQLDPGQTTTVQATIKSGKGQKGDTAVNLTPSIVPGASTQTWKSAC